MNKYYEKDGYMVGVCSDGTEFLFDKEDYGKVSQWNWVHHHKGIDGNMGKSRVSLGRLITGKFEKSCRVTMKNKGYDFRKDNLFVSNQFIDKGDYYEVLTRSGKTFYIDKEDCEIVQKYQWRINTQGYPEAQIDGRRIKLHRYLLGVYNELFTYDRVVDHIDRNPRNNRRCNLRIVTQAENARNQDFTTRNKSGVVNVIWSAEMNAWRAYKMIDGIRHNIGNFNTIDEAKEAVEQFNYCVATGQRYSDMSTHHRKSSQSGEKYIYKHKPHGYTVCIITPNHQHVYLGLYNDIDEAINVRDKYLEQQK